jgi:predicted phosphodiesterase
MTKRTLKIIARELFISDLQIPFQDDACIEIMFDVAKDLKPDLIWLGGDILDDYSLSSYITSNEIDFLYEIELTKNFLNKLRQMFPKSKIIWQEGNHEQRFRNYILKRAPKLEGLLKIGNLAFDKIFDLEKLKIQYIIGPAKVEKLYHLHGHERKFTGQLVHVALNYARWLHANVIFGHWHVSNQFLLKEIDGSYKEAYANPCLFDITKMPYGGYTQVDLNHRGFSIVYYTSNGFFSVERIILINTKTGILLRRGDDFFEYQVKANNYKIHQFNLNERKAIAEKSR